MTSGDLKDMIEYTKNYKKWIESVTMRSQEEENGRANLITQMEEAIQKWECLLSAICETTNSRLVLSGEG